MELKEARVELVRSGLLLMPKVKSSKSKLSLRRLSKSKTPGFDKKYWVSHTWPATHILEHRTPFSFFKMPPTIAS